MLDFKNVFSKSRTSIHLLQLMFPQSGIDFSQVLLPISRPVRFKCILEAWHILKQFPEKR